MKNTQSGRSMVEMLGVLAIIGMLSVGGIWGLSEAIERYKLNKATAQISAILNSVSAHLYDSWVRTADERVSIIPYFKYKTPALFDDMPIVKSGNEPYEFLQDAMGAYISIYINKKGWNNETKVQIGSKPSREAPIDFMKIDTGVAYCRNVMLLLQSIYKDNPKKICFIHLRNPGNIIMPVWNGANYSFDFANMSFGQATNVCYDAITAGKGKFWFLICFSNRKE